MNRIMLTITTAIRFNANGHTAINLAIAGALLLALFAALGCSAQEPTATRAEVLVSATDDLIVPRFQEVAQGMNALQAALVALCDNPTQQRLGEARDAWRSARVPWMRSQAMWFGPVMDRRTRSYVDWAPVEPERIENMLADRDSVDALYLKDYLASTQRGLGAVEYVIFDDDAAALDALGQPGSIRCQYLLALGELAVAETNGALADWTGDNAEAVAYATFFNGTANDSLLSKTALNELVRTSVFMSRTITDMRLGKALGINGVDADPSAILAGSGNNAIADLRNQVLGMQDVYLGGAEGGLGNTDMGVSALVRGLSEETDTAMRTAFTNALTAIDALEEPLPDTLQSNPAAALDAHAALKQMQLTLSTDIVSLLDITVGFADTDGDGG